MTRTGIFFTYFQGERLRDFPQALADRICQGRLIVILCGGSGRAVAAYTIPKIISCLAEISM